MATLQLWAFLFSVYYLKIKIAQPRRSSHSVIMGCLFCPSSLFLMATGILRASCTETRVIGTDPVVTVLFCLGSGFFFSALAFFLSSLMDLLLMQSRHKGSETHQTMILFHSRMKIAVPLSAFIGIVSCAMPLGFLRAAPEDFFAWSAAHYFGCMLEQIFLATAATVYCCVPLARDLRTALKTDVRGSSSENLKAVLAKLEQYNSEIRKQSTVNVTIACLFGGWPFLWSMSSYWLPIAWMSGSVITSLSMYMHLPIAKTDSSAFKQMSGVQNNTNTGTRSSQQVAVVATGSHGQDSMRQQTSFKSEA